ncbi:MAG: hypothetical protein LBC40_09025, partial [Dysgonamonadaceae bacterium]|nr:hypothetical protein [Dysgonamonadaceae bacterium]
TPQPGGLNICQSDIQPSGLMDRERFPAPPPSRYASQGIPPSRYASLGAPPSRFASLGVIYIQTFGLPVHQI